MKGEYESGPSDAGPNCPRWLRANWELMEAWQFKTDTWKVQGVS